MMIIDLVLKDNYSLYIYQHLIVLHLLAYKLTKDRPTKIHNG